MKSEAAFQNFKGRSAEYRHYGAALDEAEKRPARATRKGKAVIIAIKALAPNLESHPVDEHHEEAAPTEGWASPAEPV
ncbi:Urocanate hydratase [Clarias magur]|uniref:Urocanate hydratase n=1 Tax=Clarias magur TaxID=1594786 RepID=A0A8J4WUK2_CLAMG|nr:Urocanate hydratase [Clarias magur]